MCCGLGGDKSPVPTREHSSNRACSHGERDRKEAAERVADSSCLFQGGGQCLSGWGEGAAMRAERDKRNVPPEQGSGVP